MYVYTNISYTQDVTFSQFKSKETMRIHKFNIPLSKPYRQAVILLGRNGLRCLLLVTVKITQHIARNVGGGKFGKLI